MQERLALLDQLRQSEIRATGLRVASVVGHLIGTPLNVIVGRAGLILSDPDPQRVEQNARKIEEQVGKLTRRIRRLIDYLNPTAAVTEPMAVARIIKDALALYGPIAQQRGVPLLFEEHGVTDMVVEDGATALVLLSSMLSMAVRGAPNGSEVRIAVRTADAQSRFEVLIPGVSKPRGRIDSLEPPDDADPTEAEHLQTLAVGSALARRLGGHLEVTATDRGELRVSFDCTCAAA
ncbi:MAG TPA: hypothetical protein VHM70_29410 [Polyangiaceae bacterium]|nr:hypothetical protein [Polyangiaceae bacterium]